jgi:hypothetical protein
MGKSESSSSANQTTTTNNIDKRIVTERGLIATEGATVNYTGLDADIVGKALDTVQINDAQNGEGFTKLLSLADKVISGTGELLNKGQDQVLQAAQSVQAEKQGSIDQKTIMILGVAAAAAFAVSRRK